MILSQNNKPHPESYEFLTRYLDHPDKSVIWSSLQTINEIATRHKLSISDPAHIKVICKVVEKAIRLGNDELADTLRPALYRIENLRQKTS